MLMELRWGKERLGGWIPWWEETAGGGWWAWLAASGRLRGQKLRSCTAVLSKKKIEHAYFFTILGPSTVDLVAANSGGGDRVMHGVGGGSGWP